MSAAMPEGNKKSQGTPMGRLRSRLGRGACSGCGLRHGMPRLHERCLLATCAELCLPLDIFFLWEERVWSVAEDPDSIYTFL